MKSDRANRDARNDRRESAPSAPRATPSSWARPDFTEVSACAEICAYVYRA